MICSNCKANIPDNAAFCPECGHKAEPPVPEQPIVQNEPKQAFCPSCGTALTAGEVFCGNCGTKIIAQVQAEENVTKQEALAVAKKLPIKKLIAVAAVVAVVALAALVIFVFGSGGAGDSYALYIKDGEMQYLELPNGEQAVELTSNLLDGESISNAELTNMYLNTYYRLSSDGKRMFYADKIEKGYYNITEYTLYYQELGSKEGPVKIDSGITACNEDTYQFYYYYVNEKGNLVTYLKDGKLYQHNLEEKTKIAGDVTQYYASTDGNTLVYLVQEDDEEGNLYMFSDGEETKLASGVTWINHVSSDLSVILYSKDDSLYKIANGGEAEKIASDVDSVICTYDSGEVYYTKKEESEVSCWDFVVDDLSSSDYDYRRSLLQEDTITYPVSSLCYYNGTDSVVITEYTSGNINSCNMKTPVLVYAAVADGELPKIKLSEIVESDNSFYTLFYDKLQENVEYYIAVKDVSIETGLEDVYAYSCLFTDDAKTGYIAAEYDEEEYVYSLYKVSISDGAIASSELFADEVWAARMIDSNSLLYWSDVDDEGLGEIYLNGKKIDDDAAAYTYYCSKDGDLYYMVDVDSEKEQGTLKCYDGKESQSIADDVRNVALTPDGDVLYLYDYSTKSYKGELWIWDGKEATKLDDDVVSMFVVGNWTDR